MTAMSRAGKGRARLNLLAIYSMIFLNNMGMLMSPSMDTLVNAFPSEPYSKVLLISTLPALVALPFIMLAGNLYAGADCGASADSKRHTAFFPAFA